MDLLTFVVVGHKEISNRAKPLQPLIAVTISLIKKSGVKKKISRLVQRLTEFVKAANFLLYIMPKQMIYL